MHAGILSPIPLYVCNQDLTITVPEYAPPLDGAISMCSENPTMN